MLFSSRLVIKTNRLKQIYCRAGTGFTQPGIYGVAVVLGIELVGKQYRSFIAVIANVFGVVGGVIKSKIVSSLNNIDLDNSLNYGILYR